MSQSNQEFDVVLWGATGFTGRLVAHYLANNYGPGSDLRWALAGRNPSKVEAVRAELGASSDVPILVADSSDESSLRALVEKTSTVMATVGPFAKYGTPLVKLCAETGTHYCDITGEVHWVARMVEQFHDIAKRSGARIVHCCGFDSIPSDLGTWLAATEMKSRHGAACATVDAYVNTRLAGMSGGSMASVFNVAEEMANDASVRQTMSDRFAIVPSAQRPSRKEGDDLAWARKSDDIDAWTAPFIMAPVNSRIVYRSNALLGDAYGKGFKYSERLVAGRGAAGWRRAMGQGAQISALMATVAVGPLRKMAQNKSPQPGQGPSEAQRAKARFHLDFVARGEPGGEGAPVVRARVGSDGDPGYDETAKMLCESAVCLAKGDALSEGGGVLTPASAMAAPLVDRLRRAGMTLEIT